MTIDARGLFEGNKLRRCSDKARLLWVHLFLASNEFARLEIDLPLLSSRCFFGFKDPPTPSDLIPIIREYRDVGLLFLYPHAGSLWGQWICPSQCTKRHKSAADKRSPEPQKDALNSYILETTDNASLQHFSELLLKNSPSPIFAVRGVGLGVGNGKGVGVGLDNGKSSESSTSGTGVPINTKPRKLLYCGKPKCLEGQVEVGVRQRGQAPTYARCPDCKALRENQVH